MYIYSNPILFKGDYVDKYCNEIIFKYEVDYNQILPGCH